MKSWIELSEERLTGNFRVLGERAGPPIAVMAVIKANAYGHGSEQCAVTLARAGAEWFGVADVCEGATVRRALDAAGFPGAEILTMCGLLPGDEPTVTAARLTPVVWTVEQVNWLSGSAGVKVHIEVETGMGRQGARPGAELVRVLDAVRGAGLGFGGLMTHFCSAEVVGSPKTAEQQAVFERAVEQVRAQGRKPEWVHAGASSSLDNPDWNAEWLAGLAEQVEARAMVRCGISLYGYCNPLRDGEPQIRHRLSAVMTWKTRVLDVREIQTGDCIGYNSTFIATKPMKLAVLPVGYADGLRRALSSTNEHEGGCVLVRGMRAPIVGRISMNLTMVDVSGIADVVADDEVILLGDGWDADDHARIVGTVSYEILTGVRTEG